MIKISKLSLDIDSESKKKNLLKRIGKNISSTKIYERNKNDNKK